MDGNPNDNQNQVAFTIQRVYLKDASFEAPGAPQIFQQQAESRLGLDLSTKSQKLDERTWEVSLSVTATVKLKDDKVAFIAEAEQAGIFGLEGFAGEELQRMLATLCPGILFPYAREAIDNLVAKGSFPPLMLAPVNFDALYARELEKKQNSR